jgi:hypothetical protein
VPVLDHETAALLTGGGALIVGAVDPRGLPYALRGWGLDVLEHDPLRVRILLDAHEHEAIDCLAPSRPVAVTAADVRTLRSVQLKGRSHGVDAAGPHDAARVDRYVDMFFGDIVATDGTPRAVLERILPDTAALVALTVAVDDHFDQTPGPSAGRSVDAST